MSLKYAGLLLVNLSLIIWKLIYVLKDFGQGGSVFVETEALAMFVEGFASYLGCIRSLSHVASSEEHVVTETGENMAAQDGHPSEGQQKTLQQRIWEQLEVFTVDLSQLSLFLVAAEESGITIFRSVGCKCWL